MLGIIDVMKIINMSNVLADFCDENTIVWKLNFKGGRYSEG